MQVKKFNSIETENVRLVHDLSNNKLSLSVLTEQGYETLGEFDSVSSFNKYLDVLVDELNAIRKSEK